MKVAIIDGMAELQTLDKQRWINSCELLAEHFNDCLFHKYRESDEVRLIFDRYDVSSSLKIVTRVQTLSRALPKHLLRYWNRTKTPKDKLDANFPGAWRD